MPSFPEPRQPLTDGAVTLRLGAERDIPEVLIAYQDDPELHLRIGAEKPPSGAELGRRAERAAHEMAAGRWLTWTILEPGSDAFCGELNVHHVDWESRRAELGIWLVPALRGRGLARRALRLASAWLLAECSLERIQLLTDPDNEPLLRAAAAAGFTHEGVLRAYQRERGMRVDCSILSLVRGDLAA